MKIVKVRSKSNPKIFRQVRIKEGLDGLPLFECSCPANVWYRVSNGRHGKEICSHIAKVIEQEAGLDKGTKKS
jgi:hypothetical protein